MSQESTVYGCHSTRAPDRFKNPIVRSGNGEEHRAGWPHRMTTACQYDKRAEDIRCEGCAHE